MNFLNGCAIASMTTSANGASICMKNVSMREF